MSDQGTIRDDISYMRKLAESGHRGQILGGTFLAVAGVLFGAGCIVSFVLRYFAISIPGYSEARLWIAINAIFWLFWLAMVLRLRARGQAKNAASAVFGVIWAAMAAGVMTALGTTMLLARELNALIILNAYIPVIFSFYGSAWIASAALAKRRWMYSAGLASLLYAFVVAILAESQWQSLAMGVGLFLLLALPGFKLISDETRP